MRMHTYAIQLERSRDAPKIHQTRRPTYSKYKLSDTVAACGSCYPLYKQEAGFLVRSLSLVALVVFGIFKRGVVASF